MRAVILDGWHRGRAYDVPGPMPIIRLPRPTVVTVCDCDPGSDPNEFTAPYAIHDYSLAFRSVDGRYALYSERGRSDAIVESRDWVMPREASLRPPDPIVVGCRDDLAWPDERPDELERLQRVDRAAELLLECGPSINEAWLALREARRR